MFWRQHRGIYMTSKERLLLAINGEKPDRLPLSTHGLMGSWIKNYTGFDNALDLFRHTGMDASIFTAPFIERTSPDWKEEVTTEPVPGGTAYFHKITTPKGVLTYSCEWDGNTSWVTDYMIKDDDDIYLLKYRPLPYFDKGHIQKIYDQVGDSGIIRSGGMFGYQEGCWPDACELYGTEKMIFAAVDKPEWVHEFLGILLEQKLLFIDESMKGAKFDLVLTGGGGGSNTVISPAMHREFCLPYDQKMHEHLKALGHKTVYHLCGGVTKVVDCVLENGCDALETLTPLAIGGDITNPGQITEFTKGKISIMGGMDQLNILAHGTKDEIKKEVHKLFDWYGKDGGYIALTTDHFFDVPYENFQAYAEAAKECVY